MQIARANEKTLGSLGEGILYTYSVHSYRANVNLSAPIDNTSSLGVAKDAVMLGWYS